MADAGGQPPARRRRIERSEDEEEPEGGQCAFCKKAIDAEGPHRPAVLQCGHCCGASCAPPPGSAVRCPSCGQPVGPAVPLYVQSTQHFKPSEEERKLGAEMRRTDRVREQIDLRVREERRLRSQHTQRRTALRAAAEECAEALGAAQAAPRHWGCGAFARPTGSAGSSPAQQTRSERDPTRLSGRKRGTLDPRRCSELQLPGAAASAAGSSGWTRVRASARAPARAVLCGSAGAAALAELTDSELRIVQSPPGAVCLLDAALSENAAEPVAAVLAGGGAALWDTKQGGAAFACLLRAEGSALRRVAWDSPHRLWAGADDGSVLLFDLRCHAVPLRKDRVLDGECTALVCAATSEGEWTALAAGEADTVPWICGGAGGGAGGRWRPMGTSPSCGAEIAALAPCAAGGAAVCASLLGGPGRTRLLSIARASRPAARAGVPPPLCPSAIYDVLWAAPLATSAELGGGAQSAIDAEDFRDLDACVELDADGAMRAAAHAPAAAAAAAGPPPSAPPQPFVVALWDSAVAGGQVLWAAADVAGDGIFVGAAHAGGAAAALRRRTAAPAVEDLVWLPTQDVGKPLLGVCSATTLVMYTTAPADQEAIDVDCDDESGARGGVDGGSDDGDDDRLPGLGHGAAGGSGVITID
eukprot:TRINITY_DN13742_c0_g1_i2.p1 TRINITY_DN13742_c0_g1~~TRINITY_DN13742_c0_g1_i2.p1  ORF type:complete len:670 (+),score=115.01 TRINITY_DN13742_c0_g1_i2:79-2010(+)